MGLASNLSSRLCAPHILIRVLLVLAVSCTLTVTAWLWQRSPQSAAPVPESHHFRLPSAQNHPIDILIKKADKQLHSLLAKESLDLRSAARAYRERRGRHPPPGFDKWFQFAHENGAVIVEEFFDQIYHDLTPFWGVEARQIRQQAKNFEQVVSVRNGTATQKSDKQREWMDLWHNLVASIEKWLPDIDVPINVMDESRVIVPWEEINDYVERSKKSRKIIPNRQVVKTFTGLKDIDENPGEPVDLEFIKHAAYWDVARVGCSPHSPSRNVSAQTDFTGPPLVPEGFPLGSYHGYVQNWTEAKDPCLQPGLRESHGTFVEPISQSTTHKLFPMFGGSKLPMNNEILIPPAMYWSHREMYTGGEEHGGPWEEKKTAMVWRGGATGGRNKLENWKRFQRHRFLSMVNGTTVLAAEQDPEKPGQGPNFDLLPTKAYGLKTPKVTDLGVWLQNITDVGFVHLICFPNTGNATCPYTDPYFAVVEGLKMKDMYSYKYLPDIDGNSFSGRYWGFLQSTSLPIKATIYSEWHDSRLMPWLHFIPMDNSFVDIYGILEYFIGSGPDHEDAHDDVAKKIALAGKRWAERVLRREDMMIYMMRLLMEYARVCDDKREKLGFIDDLERRPR